VKALCEQRQFSSFEQGRGGREIPTISLSDFQDTCYSDFFWSE
jgi:hypothetical protein